MVSRRVDVLVHLSARSRKEDDEFRKTRARAFFDSTVVNKINVLSSAVPTKSVKEGLDEESIDQGVREDVRNSGKHAVKSNLRTSISKLEAIQQKWKRQKVGDWTDESQISQNMSVCLDSSLPNATPITDHEPTSAQGPSIRPKDNQTQAPPPSAIPLVTLGQLQTLSSGHSPRTPPTKQLFTVNTHQFGSDDSGPTSQLPETYDLSAKLRSISPRRQSPGTPFDVLEPALKHEKLIGRPKTASGLSNNPHPKNLAAQFRTCSFETAIPTAHNGSRQSRQIRSPVPARRLCSPIDTLMERRECSEFAAAHSVSNHSAREPDQVRVSTEARASVARESSPPSVLSTNQEVVPHVSAHRTNTEPLSIQHRSVQTQVTPTKVKISLFSCASADEQLKQMPLEIRAPNSEVDCLTWTTRMSHLASGLSELIHSRTFAGKFKPLKVHRQLDKDERGCWQVDTSLWPSTSQLTFWTAMQRLLNRGSYGISTYCRRQRTEEDNLGQLGNIQLWGFAEQMEGLYWLLVLASTKLVHKQGAQWVDCEGKIVIQMLNQHSHVINS